MGIDRGSLTLFQNHFKGRFWGIFLPALFFSATLFYFAPATIYFTNPQEFPLPFSYLQPYFIVITIAVAVSITLAILILKPFPEQIIVVLLVSVAGLLWAQGNIPTGKGYGLLDGHNLHWEDFFLKNLLELCLWFFLIRLALYRRNAVFKVAVRLSIMFILIQLLSLAYLVIQGGRAAGHKRYMLDDSGRCSFSRNKNVIFLVLDSFQTDVFQEIVDENHYYINNFDGFTYFRNALGGYPTTRPSITLILTGKYYDNSMPFQEFMQEAYLSGSSLTKRLKENGFEVNIYGEGASAVYLDPRLISNIAQVKDIYGYLFFIYDIALFRYTPYPLKKYIYRDQRWFLKSLYDAIIKSTPRARTQGIKKSLLKKQFSIDGDIDFINELTANAKTDITKSLLYFYHLRAVHPPFIRNGRLLYEELPADRNGYKKQAKGVMLLVERFLQTLHRIRIYDNSMILIIGDHGSGYDVVIPEKLKRQASSMAYTVPPIIKAKALPLILIKPFYARGGMHISDSPVGLGDIPATVASTLGFKGEFLGRSMYDIQASKDRMRRHLSYVWKHEYWQHDCLPEMKEYIVSGFSWDDASWIETGREFKFLPEQRHNNLR